MDFQSLYIYFILVVLCSTTIDAQRHRSARQTACANPAVDACLFVTCENGGVCVQDLSTVDCYKCNCQAGYTGKVCDATIPIIPGGCNPICQNGGVCSGTVCQCPSSYTGLSCEIRDYCAPSNPCQNGGRCTSFTTSYQCDCTGTGYTGTDCTVAISTDPCVPNPCQNGGQCSVNGQTVNCLCYNGYTGAYCQIAPIPCATAPCENGGTCTLIATNTYGCSCPAEYTGSQCQTSIYVNHPCITMPGSVCLNGATCTILGTNYVCRCAPGWTGTNCQTVGATPSSCSPDPCNGHGTCVEAVTSTGPTAFCTCDSQWTGKYCDININGGCVAGYCVTGTCQLIGNTPFCNCPAQYTGQRCDTLISSVTTTTAPVVTSCSPSPCQNGGTCYSYVGGYGCACPSGWGGPTCAVLVAVTTTAAPSGSPCASSPCLYGGTCYRNGNAFACVCTSGWTGQRCETSTSVIVTTPTTGITCANLPCKNGGTCYNSGSSYYCQCPSVYSGTNCETILATSCPLNCAPGYCTASGSSSMPYVCMCNGVMKLTSCTSK